MTEPRKMVSRRCLCGRLVWGWSYEELGDQPLHGCCRIWLIEHDREACAASRKLSRRKECAACRGECPACLSSDAAARDWRRRQEEKQKQARKAAAAERAEAQRLARKKAAARSRANRTIVRSTRAPRPVPPPRPAAARPAPPRRGFADAINERTTP